MQFLWQVDDFKDRRDPSALSAFGSIVRQPRNDSQYLIGYTNGTGENPCLISLDDGMVTLIGRTIENFVGCLNEQKFFPLVSKRKPHLKV